MPKVIAEKAELEMANASVVRRSYMLRLVPDAAMIAFSPKLPAVGSETSSPTFMEASEAAIGSDRRAGRKGGYFLPSK